jgi:hypothetical protein
MITRNQWAIIITLFLIALNALIGALVCDYALNTHFV